MRLANNQRSVEQGGLAAGLEPIDGVLRMFSCVGQAHNYYLIYTGVSQPAVLELTLPEGEQYQAEVIDTWGRTITPLAKPVTGRAAVPLSGKPYHALTLRRIG